MQAGKSKICWWANRLGTQEGLRLWFISEYWLLEEFPLLQGRPVFVIFRPSADQMRPTYIMVGNLLYFKFTELNFNLIQNTLTETFRKMCDHISGHIGPVKSIHKFNHNTVHLSKFCISQQACLVKIHILFYGEFLLQDNVK